ncbi:multidrug transporter MatE [Bacillus coahuilensis m2-6]|nr:multidrug transporter MatE [Bacillus coahuilensis m2-6]
MEFIINLQLAQHLGEEGLGHYMSLLPIFFLIVIIASLELPISLSKFIAEKERSYHREALRHTIFYTVILTGFLLTFFIVLFTFFPIFSEYHSTIRWLFVVAIPITAFSSLCRGYFMGVHQMGKVAVSNFLRKGVQLILLIFVFRLYDFSGDTALFIALTLFLLAEAVVCLYLLFSFYLYWIRSKDDSFKQVPRKEVGKALLEVSVPTTILRVFHAATHAIQPFLIKAALIHSGMDVTTSTEQFGLLAGVALTIGFFPAFIAHSLLIALIPIVSEAWSKHEMKKVKRLLKNVMVITAVYSIPSILLFYFYGHLLTGMFFESISATVYLQLLWPYFLFHFFIIPFQAFLIGIGLVKEAMYHIIWSTVISYLVIWVLGSMPSLGMLGVILGMNTGAVLSASLHFFSIKEKLSLTLRPKYLK